MVRGSLIETWAKNTQDEFPGQWKVLLADKPFYCSSVTSECFEIGKKQNAIFEDTILEHKVDLVISGGNDYYERTFPVMHNSAQPFPDSSLYENPNFPTYVSLNGGKGGVPRNSNLIISY